MCMSSLKVSIPPETSNTGSRSVAFGTRRWAMMRSPSPGRPANGISTRSMGMSKYRDARSNISYDLR